MTLTYTDANVMLLPTASALGLPADIHSTERALTVDRATGQMVAKNRRSRAARLRAQAGLVPSLMSSAYMRRAVELEFEAQLIERLPA